MARNRNVLKRICLSENEQIACAESLALAKFFNYKMTDNQS
jgi:hypothetical protein